VPPPFSFEKKKDKTKKEREEKLKRKVMTNPSHFLSLFPTGFQTFSKLLNISGYVSEYR
jgi:hypothetical protein